MRCLWLTLADPDPPTNGQFLYSQGLIDAAAGAGCRLSVVGLTRRESRPRPDSSGAIGWHLADEQPRPVWASSFSPLPQITFRFATPRMQQIVAGQLAERRWDAIVFDSICHAWALDLAVAQRAVNQATVVYLSHNHEATVARHLASSGGVVRRFWKVADALKVARLEQALATQADLVTANTPEDCARFSAQAKGSRVKFLPPGFGGRRIEHRAMTVELPRRAVLVGSFDWSVKRHSLEAFLDAAAAAFRAARIQLQVIGNAEAGYLQTLRGRFPGVDFTGPVRDVQPFLSHARVALVPDLLGGFKLKALDYVFNRVPIFAMRIAVPGMPLEDGRSIALFDSHRALAQGVIDAIDNIGKLDAQQNLAFAACANRFDWQAIGRDLYNAIAEARRHITAQRAAPRTVAEVEPV